jgi:hypothetical protein
MGNGETGGCNQVQKIQKAELVKDPAFFVFDIFEFISKKPYP